MLIPVIYPNGTHDLVKDFYLDFLISTEKVVSFKRSTGWVEVDSPHVRGKNQRCFYTGPERRKNLIREDILDDEEEPIEFYPVDSFERFEHE